MSRGTTGRASTSMSDSHKYAKRGPVIMPVEPPYDVLLAMAGDPLILAASDELACRELYVLMREALAKRKRK